MPRSNCSPACHAWGSYGHIDGTEDMLYYPDGRFKGEYKGIHHYGNYKKGIRKVAAMNIAQLETLGWTWVGGARGAGSLEYAYMKPPEVA